MPKRRRSKEEDLEHLSRKIRKLERKIRKRRISVTSTNSPSSKEEHDAYGATPALRPEDWLLDYPDYQINQENEDSPDALVILSPPQTAASPRGPSPLPAPRPSSPQPGPSTSSTTHDTCTVQPTEGSAINLDPDILEILGEDPNSVVKYGAAIREELASRLQHIATKGLSKECRKELLTKYLIPINCLYIDAPKTNPEIKAAIPSHITKREKAIESRQKQLASAISALGEVTTIQLGVKDKDNVVLQKLMDISRILCDIQHADSVTRRNFILYSLKKDMTDHLNNTLIDSFLFGENLPDTLKSAKAVNKSGVELKAASENNNLHKRMKPTTSSKPFLGRKAPAQMRRPPPQGPPRGRETAPVQRVPPRPPQPPAYSSRPSTQQATRGRQRRF